MALIAAFYLRRRSLPMPHYLAWGAPLDTLIVACCQPDREWGAFALERTNSWMHNKATSLTHHPSGIYSSHIIPFTSSSTSSPAVDMTGQ